METILRRRGFTLVEMMVVITIASLLLCAGVPSFQSFLQQRRLAHAADAFFHATRLTRTLAMRHGERAVMRPLQADDWSSGWQVSAAGQVMLQQPPLPAGITVTQNANGGSIRFGSTGQAVPAGTWTLRLAGQPDRRIVINFVGRVRQQRGTPAR